MRDISVIGFALLLSTLASAQVTSTRVTGYDWRCEDDQGVKISHHQREGLAITACANRSIADGKTYYVQGGRYRITAKPAVVPDPVPPPPPPPPTGNVTLDWSAPAKNTDGTTLADLAGYRIRYGTSPTSLTQTAQVTSPGTTSYVVQGLSSGTWYFSVAAYNATGTESVLSNPVSAAVP